jgi:hypothetical protein
LFDLRKVSSHLEKRPIIQAPQPSRAPESPPRLSEAKTRHRVDFIVWDVQLNSRNVTITSAYHSTFLPQSHSSLRTVILSHCSDTNIVSGYRIYLQHHDNNVRATATGAVARWANRSHTNPPYDATSTLRIASTVHATFVLGDSLQHTVAHITAHLMERPAAPANAYATDTPA